MLCAAVVVAAASGCEGTAPEVQDPAIVTAGNSFELRKEEGRHTWYSATVPYTYTNRSESTVYVAKGGANCIGIEKYEGGEWVRHYAAGAPCLGDLAAIEPGEVRQDTVRVWFCALGERCGPRLTLPAASIRFRIVLLPWSSLARELVPLAERVSNNFTFEVVGASH